MKTIANYFLILFLGTSVFTTFSVFANTGLGSQIRLQSRTLETTTFLKSHAFSIVKNSVAHKEWIVQFKNTVGHIELNQLRAKGLNVVSYIPDNAYLIYGSSQLVMSLKANENIQAIVPLNAFDKISVQLSPISVFNKTESELVLVRLYSFLPTEDFSQFIKRQSAVEVIDAYKRDYILKIPRELRLDFALRSDVEFVQSVLPLTPLRIDLLNEDSLQPNLGKGDYTDLDGSEAGTQIMNFASLWAQGYTGRGQIGGMADTGLDNGNIQNVFQDFQGAIKSGAAYGLYAKSWDDPMGHGTHVAGSILGRGTVSGGLLRGGAFDSQLVAQGMWSPMLDNLSVPSRLDDMFLAAYKDGARIHSNSWGSPRNPGAYDSFANTVDTVMWNAPDYLIVFAAGNSGVDLNKDGRIDPGSVGTPATAKNVLSVGASENVTQSGGIQVPISQLRSAKDNWSAEPIFSSKVSDNKDGVAMFSSRGPTNDGRLKPDVVAPGTNILSVKSHTPTAQNLWGAYNADYVFSGGTSMSTPLVAGSLLVLRQYMVEKLKVVNPSAALMKAALMATAVDMYPGQYGQGSATQELSKRRPNSDEGYGRVDVSQFPNLDQALMIDEVQGLATNQEKAFSFQHKGGRLVIQLNYTDAPAATTAAAALVNDLDLQVVLASGEVKSLADKINNHEMIEVFNLPAQEVQIKVRGVRVAQPKTSGQPFAMVATSIQ